MKYEKPEIVRMDSAISVVQSQGKFHGTADLGDPGSDFPSIPAYEADE
jgi:hypothetical protein